MKRYVLRAKVRVRDVTSEYDIWAAWGHTKPEMRHWTWARSGAGEPVWDTEQCGGWPWGDEGILRDRRAVGMGTRRVISKGERRKVTLSHILCPLIGLAQELGTHDEATADDYLLHRIAHGVAEGAVDIPPNLAFPMESNLDLMGGSAWFDPLL